MDTGKFGVKPVERVVEVLEVRPAKVAMSSGVVFAVREQEVARRLE